MRRFFSRRNALFSRSLLGSVLLVLPGSRPGFRKKRQKKRKKPLPPWVLSLGLGLFLAVGVIFLLDHRLGPVVQTLALTQANNLLSDTITQHILEETLPYEQFVTIERNDKGEVTALTSNMSSLNQMRSQLVARVLTSLEEVDISVIEVPLGSLLDSELFWAKGPGIQARAMSVGTISAQFHSEFTHSGINQTLHRIYLQVDVPIYLIMAGDTLETVVETQLCVSETVIVGVVPDSNLQLYTALPALATFTAPIL